MTKSAQDAPRSEPPDELPRSVTGSGSRLSRHFVVNLIGAITGLSVSLITVPIYIREIGDARYGVLSIVWILLGYLGFLDLGLSRAATNALSRLTAAQKDERSRIVLTSVAINAVLGSIGAALVFILGSVLMDRVVSIPPGIRSELGGGFIWVAALLPLTLISGTAIGSLEARERFVPANVLQLGTSLVGQVLPALCAIFIGPELSIVVPATVIARGIGIVAVILYVLRCNGPWLWSAPDRRTVGTLLGYGSWVTVSAAISPILQSVDQIVIGHFIGVAAVTYYAIPMSLVMRSQFLSAAMVRSIFPILSKESHDDGKLLSERAIVFLAYSYGAICASAMFLVDAFFRIWIGEEFSLVGAPIARILLLGAWINGIAFIPFSTLQAQGRPDVPAKFHLLELVPFLAVLSIMSSQFGLIGAAVAWSMRVFVDATALLVVTRISARTIGAIAPVAITLITTCIWTSLNQASLAGGIVWSLASTIVIGGAMLVVSPWARHYALRPFNSRR